MKCLTLLNQYRSNWFTMSIGFLLLISFPFHGMKAQELLPHDRPHSIQSDSLLKALERALFPPNTTLVRIRDYPDCWEYEMEMDTNILVRLPQPDEDEVLKLLSQIAFSKKVQYMEPLSVLYERHQDYFKKEWEDVRKHNKYGCNEKNRLITIMHAFEHTLQTLQYVKERWSCERIWMEYQKIRDLDYRVQIDIGSFNENTQSYPFYSEYFREVRRMQNSWFAYGVAVRSHIPFITCLEPYMLAQSAATLNISIPEGSFSQDTSWRKASRLFSSNLYDMSFMYSPVYEQWLIDNFERIRELLFDIVGVFTYAQNNPNVSKEYVEFLLNKLYNHPRYDSLDYLTMERWCNNLIHQRTRPIIKPYLLAKANSPKTLDRVKAFAMLVQFPEEDVLDLFLSSARSRHTTDEELEVLYNNLKRIDQGKYFSEERHNEVKEQLEKMKTQRK